MSVVRVGLLLAWPVAFACGIGTRALPAPPRPALTQAAARPASAGPLVTEAQARVVMAARFRAEGMRVVHDVVVGAVTLDGADPQRRIGFEYIAAAEADVVTPLHAAPAGAAQWSVLVASATTLADLEQQLDAFFMARNESDP